MKITVSGKQVEVGAALSQHIEDNLTAGVKKYFEGAVSAHVTLSKLRHLFIADILVNDGTGTHMLVKGRAEADDAYAAVDLCIEKIEKQLRRYKRKLKSHHGLRSGKRLEELAALEGRKYVLSAEEGHEEANQENESPLIIAEMPQPIEELSVSDAVMRMDLGELPAYVFINRKTGAVNMVYRRTDGNITWIDSGVAGSYRKKDVA